MENEEKIIQKIKKVLELSRNNPSEEEAKSAALMAQQLLAKYNLSIEEVDGIDASTVNSIDEVRVDVPAKKWKYMLSDIVARNFRCKHFYYGKGTVVFYGYSADVRIAAETFSHLFAIGDKLANKEVRKVMRKCGSASDVYNSFVTGYCRGLDSVLSQQCAALMLVVPEDVNKSYDDKMRNARTMRVGSPRTGYNAACSNAYANGVSAGQSTANSRHLEN